MFAHSFFYCFSNCVLIKMETLRGFTLANLYESLGWKDDKFIEWLQQLGLLCSTQTCICGEVMRQRGVRKGKNYGDWQCSAKKCRKERGFLVGTWFEGTHLTLKEASLPSSSQKRIWYHSLPLWRICLRFLLASTIQRSEHLLSSLVSNCWQLSRWINMCVNESKKTNEQTFEFFEGVA